MHVTLSEAEVSCLKALAERYERGEFFWDSEGGWETIGLTNENFQPVLGMLEKYGYIESVTHTTSGFFSMFSISPTAVQTVRVIAEDEKKKQEPRDIVEHVKTTMRKHPVYGWGILIAMVATLVVTAMNQLISLLKNLGAL